MSHQATCLLPTSFVCEDSASGGSTECRARVADAGAADDDVVVFVLDDGSRIDARRRVMSHSSDVFAAMLAGRFRESTERAVRIRAAASGAFRTMVACLHDDRPPRRSAPGLDELCRLLALFHRFQIPDAVRRRTLLAPLIAAALEGADCGGKFARVYRLLSVYDDAGVLRGDFVVSPFTRQMSLRRRCAAVAGVVSAEAECDVEEFVSIVTAALLNAIN